jgi:hypothetical protein
MWVIIIRALVSWVNPDPWNPIVQFGSVWGWEAWDLIFPRSLLSY